MAQKPTSTSWDHQYNTLRREDLFRNPPTDHTAYPLLQQAVNPHIESFDAVFANDGLLAKGLADIGTKVFLDGDDRTPVETRNKLSIRYKGVQLSKSLLPPANKFASKREVLPAECRERHVSYRGKLAATFEYTINDGDTKEFTREIGLLPIMVKSGHCHLRGNSPAQLVARREESEELGGYFIINGIEKIIRLLLLNRRNFPLAIYRPSFTNRGPAYTPFGIILRCVRPDETSQTNVLHYLNDGNVTFRFSWRKNEYLVPVMMVLKALMETNDREIFEGLVGSPDSKGIQNTFLTDRVELLLRTYKTYGVYTMAQTRAYLGEKFRPVLGVPDALSNYEVGTEFLRRVVLVHLGNINVTEEQDSDKFRLLLLMIRKLYALVAGDCAVDNPDAVQNQEILLGGFLYGQIIKERLDELISSGLRLGLREYFRKAPSRTFTSDEFRRDFPIKIFQKTNEQVGTALEYFMSTGNLASPSGLDLQQVSGFTVVAEKLNFLRFISHFRMVHRGSFFAQLKTTTVRKLLPESWGFLCPVHTPDGSPCGLLNHLAHKCKIMTGSVDATVIPQLAAELGVVDTSSAATDESVVVMLNGRILGWCKPSESRRIADTFRYWKVEGSHGIPLELEIGHVPSSNGGSYPGIFMSAEPARMVRPTKYLPLEKEDLVGTLEQPYMTIACTEQEVVSGESTHCEFDPTNILSILANMTPFSDFNQSPRNMYQCQMGKQTMGTPATALAHRTDNKMYRLQTGQTPVVRSPLHNAYGFDNFPNGTNAVVAVISYTGTVKAWTQTMLDEDGLPYVGRAVQEGDIIFAYHSVSADYSGNLVNRDGITKYEKYKDSEQAFIEEVRIIGSELGNEPAQTISIKFRVPRSPIIGDKFSSRHGQKGVCSQKWPAIDMPFSESGIQPDIIINPHAFPSRMTIGMFVESLAGKAGALHGLAQDSTPFRFDEENPAADYFGHQLMKAGYNYHGNEPMYSGITGQELAADIYIGVVYYQRLRHMVNDKYQVRTTGPVVATTGQPIKGRKRGGGIRVGEMERDALLAHGTAFLLQDRLLNCSDYTPTWVCRKCGSFLSVQPTVTAFGGKKKIANTVRCRNCARRLDKIPDVEVSKLKGEIWEDGQGNQWVGGEETTKVAVPGALKYLDVELAAMGVKLKYRVDSKDAIRKGRLTQKTPKEVGLDNKRLPALAVA
ncbi:hypothetical protein GQX73_g5481 [Xylaria multiplex]|uniref:DNA-directed RNA polymerase subunit beta n=1 Tax=Xylaria multiplex TaxID=323545 RepID=A0A7C8ISL7_9PEZI|nr:hypothetical protein GQX73_g5481 [Xylaria multiplex]